jgi:hypothetical protein
MNGKSNFAVDKGDRKTYLKAKLRETEKPSPSHTCAEAQ